MSGICPNCGSGGKLGGPCGEKNCTLHGYHFIDETVGQGQLGAGLERDALVGRCVEEYLVVDKLGEGGFGLVYKALQMPIMMETALKLLKSTTLAEGDTAKRLEKFRLEAQALARLTHPNIVRLIKYGVFENVPYMVMEYVKGAIELRHEMRARVASGARFSLPEIRSIMTQTLNALEAAHDEDLVHRDIKPENIMLQEVKGETHFVRVLDFGLAKFLADSAQTSLIQGTPIYMAPEQFMGRDIGPWTDLYSVGLVLSEMVTGLTVFDASDTTVLFRNKMDPGFDPGQNATTVGLPGASVQFIRKASAADVNTRYRSVPEFKVAMNEMLDRLVDPTAPQTQTSMRATSGKQIVTEGKIGGSGFLAGDELSPDSETVAMDALDPLGVTPEASPVTAPIAPPLAAEPTPPPAPGTPPPSPAVPSVSPSPMVSPLPAQGLAGAPSGSKPYGIIIGILVALLVLITATYGLLSGVFSGDEVETVGSDIVRTQSADAAAPSVVEDVTAQVPPDVEPKMNAVPDIARQPSPRPDIRKVPTRKPDARPQPAEPDVRPQPEDVASAPPEVKPQAKDVVAVPTDTAAPVDAAVAATDVKPVSPDAAVNKDATAATGDVAVPAGDAVPTVDLAGQKARLGEAYARLDEFYKGRGQPEPPARCRPGSLALIDPMLAALEALEQPDVQLEPLRDALLAVNEEGSKSAEFMVAMARLQRKLGSSKEAMGAAIKATEECPEMAEGWNVLGTAHLQGGELDKARDMYGKAVELSPEYTHPRFNLALVFLQQRKPESAVELLDKVIEQRPYYPNARLVRSQALLTLRRYEPAAADLEQVLAAQPDNSNAHMLMGHAKTKLGQAKAANEAYCKAKNLGNQKAAPLCKE